METFRSLQGRLRWTEAFIWPAMATSLVALGYQASSMLVLVGLAPDLWPVGWTGYLAPHHVLLVAVVTFNLGGAFTFLRWQRQAARNLSVLWWGAVDYDATRSTWSWFIPIANFFMPLYAFRELAEKSSGKRWEPDLKPLVALWWGLFWASRAIDRIAAVVIEMEGTRMTIFGQGLGILSAGSNILAGFYVLVLLRHLTRRQDQTWAELQAGPAV